MSNSALWGKVPSWWLISKWQELKSGDFISIPMNSIQLPMHISCNILMQIPGLIPDFRKATIFFIPGITTWAGLFGNIWKQVYLFICIFFLGNFHQIWKRISLAWSLLSIYGKVIKVLVIGNVFFCCSFVLTG